LKKYKFSAGDQSQPNWLKKEEVDKFFIALHKIIHAELKYPILWINRLWKVK